MLRDLKEDLGAHNYWGPKLEEVSSKPSSKHDHTDAEDISLFSIYRKQYCYVVKDSVSKCIYLQFWKS